MGSLDYLRKKIGNEYRKHYQKLEISETKTKHI